VPRQSLLLDRAGIADAMRTSWNTVAFPFDESMLFQNSGAWRGSTKSHYVKQSVGKPIE
jgi:hypothetical protein